MTSITDSLEQFGTRIIGSKDALEFLISLSPDALHVHMSLFLLFGIALIVRRRPDTWIPWTALLLFELGNEINDVMHHSLLTPLNDRAAALHDLLNTMFWPTILLMFGRILFPRSAPKAIEAEAERSDDDAIDPASNVIERK